MNRQGRVLIVDDEQRWCELLGDTLRRAGFAVDTAGAVKEAVERLEHGFYHVVVLDIRLEHSDPSNTEGMSLLRHLAECGVADATEVVMLSAYGTMKQMQEAFAHYKVADFLSKEDFDNLEFLALIRRIFAERVRLNPALTIHWQQTPGAEEMVVNLRLGAERVKRDTPLQQQLAVELEDLLCRLFTRAESLLVKPLTLGHGGGGVLLITPFFVETGAGQPVVVKFGGLQEIDAESQNFKNYVQGFIGGARSTSVIELRRTPRLGGIVYSLLGRASERLESFGSFYARSDIESIKAMLDRLFLETCAVWYANPGRLQPHDLSAEYEQLLRLTPENLQYALAHGLKSVHGKDRLHLSDLVGERTFTNPVLAVGKQRFIRPAYVCITHGDLSENNMLVDESQRPWLVDFRHSGPGHILRDVAGLDAAIRIRLLKQGDATLEERLLLEEALCRPTQFSEAKQLTDSFVTDNSALFKAYSTAAHLRLIAYKLIDRNPDNDLSEYYVALFYYALANIRYWVLPNQQRQHALISASLLIDRLTT